MIDSTTIAASVVKSELIKNSQVTKKTEAVKRTLVEVVHQNEKDENDDDMGMDLPDIVGDEEDDDDQE